MFPKSKIAVAVLVSVDFCLHFLMSIAFFQIEFHYPLPPSNSNSVSNSEQNIPLSENTFIVSNILTKGYKGSKLVDIKCPYLHFLFTDTCWHLSMLHRISGLEATNPPLIVDESELQSTHDNHQCKVFLCIRARARVCMRLCFCVCTCTVISTPSDLVFRSVILSVHNALTAFAHDAVRCECWLFM